MACMDHHILYRSMEHITSFQRWCFRPKNFPLTAVVLHLKISNLKYPKSQNVLKVLKGSQNGKTKCRFLKNSKDKVNVMSDTSVLFECMYYTHMLERHKYVDLCVVVARCHLTHTITSQICVSMWVHQETPNMFYVNIVPVFFCWD